MAEEYSYNVQTMSNDQLQITEPTILVVDDSEVNRKIIKNLLEYNKFPYIECVNGVEAVDIFQAHVEHIVAIIADIKMPKMDGVELLQRVREMAPTLPFFLVTGESFPDKMFRAKQLKVSGVLVKPLKSLAIAEKLNLSFPDRFRCKA